MAIKKSLCAIVLGAGLLLISVTNSSAFVAGDVDGDGFVRMADALVVMRYSAGTQNLYPMQKIACDVYYTPPNEIELDPESCTFIDAVIILNKAWGIIA